MARTEARKLGWAIVKNKLRCSKCEEKQKVVTVKSKVAEVADVAEPTKRQRIEIFTLLADVYDIDAGRYSKGDTDDTVADVLGVRPGWVAQIREAEFGPDGSNEEMSEVTEALETAQAEFRKLLDAIEAAEAEVSRIKTDMNASRERMNSALSKMAAIQKSLSPRITARVGK